MPFVQPTLRSLAGLVAILALGNACGGEPTSPPAPPPPPPPPPPAGVISLAASPGSVVIERGSQGATTVLVTRAGGFTGPVTLTVEGIPSGVAAVQSNVVTTGAVTSTTVTFSVATSAALGRTDLILRASGTGVADAVGIIALTVTAPPAPSYDLTVTGSPIAVTQGGNGQATITIARSGGFAGNVTLTVEGAPVGLATTLNPAATTGASSTLTVIAAAGLAPNTYTITIRGVAAGLPDRTTTVQVTVSAVTGSGDVTFDLSQCPAQAIWAAYQDGAGPWTRIIGTGGLYRFTITAPTAAFAYVTPVGGGNATIVNIQLMTRAEMSATPIVLCPPGSIGLKFINGVAVGLTPGQSAQVTLGGGLIATPTAAFPTFLLGLVPPGDRDLVAYRWTAAPAPTDRIILRRDLNLPDGGSIAPLDFAAAEAFPPAIAALTVLGMAGGEALLETMNLLTRTSCDRAFLNQAGAAAGTSHPIYGIPASARRSSDFHALRIDAVAGANARFVEESFGPLADRAVTLPGRLENAVVSILPAGYKRLEATFTFPLDYNVEARLSYIQITGTPRSVQLVATPAWVASTSARLTMPDFTGVAGWLDTWAPGTALPSRWTISTSGRDGPGTACREGARVVGATVQGTN